MTETTFDFAPAVRTEDKPPDNLLSVISRAASDPAVDVLKMEALLRLQREVMSDNAKAEFNSAYTRLTDKIPQVEKSGTITLGQGRSVAFARWEDINLVVQPLLREEGFGLTFSSRQEAGGMVVIGQLVHRDGHSLTSEIFVPPDTGPGRNSLQAIGSSLSYGKRYVTEMLLNIVRKGQDDDGTGGNPIQRGRGRAPSGWRPDTQTLYEAGQSAALRGGAEFRKWWRAQGGNTDLLTDAQVDALKTAAEAADRPISIPSPSQIREPAASGDLASAVDQYQHAKREKPEC